MTSRGHVSKASKLALARFILLACWTDVLWIRLNSGAPPRLWDDACYLAESVKLYRTLKEVDLKAFWNGLNEPARGIHPPMIKILPIPLYFALQPGTSSALYAYTLLIPVFCIYLFLLTRKLWGDDRIALLAVIITCLFALTYGLWRNLMIEFGLAVSTVAAIYHLVVSDDLRVTKHVV